MSRNVLKKLFNVLYFSRNSTDQQPKDCHNVQTPCVCVVTKYKQLQWLMYNICLVSYIRFSFRNIIHLLKECHFLEQKWWTMACFLSKKTKKKIKVKPIESLLVSTLSFSLKIYETKKCKAWKINSDPLMEFRKGPNWSITWLN